MPPADGDLILRIAQKDTQAFDTLFLKHKEAVYRFVYYLTQNRIEADDLFQDTWLRAVKYLPSSPAIRDFKAWIFTITANLHRDDLRKKKIRRIFSSQRTVEADSKIESGEASESCVVPKVVDDSTRIDINLALNQAIRQLPLKQRRVFVLKEIEGLKHSEISEILKVPVGTIKSLLHRAIKKLQVELADFKN
jgi:RNA polymerase sigma-70 factor, ECF subfamily